MVEMVLHQAVKHEQVVVVAAGNDGAELLLGDGWKFFQQLGLRRPERGDGRLTCCLAACDRRKVGVAAEFDRLSVHAPHDGARPGGDVVEELPNAVRTGDGMRGSGARVNVFDDLHHRGTVPSLAVNGAAELIGDAHDFRGHNRISSVYTVTVYTTRNVIISF